MLSCDAPGKIVALVAPLARAILEIVGRRGHGLRSAAASRGGKAKGCAQAKEKGGVPIQA
jgi:hypothetical protein